MTLVFAFISVYIIYIVFLLFQTNQMELLMITAYPSLILQNKLYIIYFNKDFIKGLTLGKCLSDVCVYISVLFSVCAWVDFVYLT